jgi:cellulose synthase/poly-beta-1,6-N-acetylglucosamine synthase-like glycosyltransferase
VRFADGAAWGAPLVSREAVMSLVWSLVEVLWRSVEFARRPFRRATEGQRFLVREGKDLVLIRPALVRPSFVLEEERDTLRVTFGRSRRDFRTPVATSTSLVGPLSATETALVPVEEPVQPTAGAVVDMGRSSRRRRIPFRQQRAAAPSLFVSPGIAAAVIPAHNEEAVIEATLRSVLAVFHAADVYVFCDNCSDFTADIARRFLPWENVLIGPRQMGKSRGLQYVLKGYIYPREYVYVTVIDADTTVEPDFLVNALKVLQFKDTACVVGQVKSRWYPKNLISVYRTYMYTLWQMFYKRLQSLTNSITIASGCAATWKTRVLSQLEFDHKMSTEDFSLTIQVHRKRLGKIKYVPSAVVWTQDPFSLTSYRKQMYRWDRAWWESVRKYRVGAQPLHFKWGIPVGLSALDVSTALLTLDLLLFMVSAFVLPVLVLHPVHIHVGPWGLETRRSIVYSLIWQYGSIVASALGVAIITRRPRVFLYSPLFIFLTYVDIVVGLRAMFSTMRSQYRRVPTTAGANVASVWVSPERRREA